MIGRLARCLDRVAWRTRLNEASHFVWVYSYINPWGPLFGLEMFRSDSESAQKYI